MGIGDINKQVIGKVLIILAEFVAAEIDCTVVDPTSDDVVKFIDNLQIEDELRDKVCEILNIPVPD